MLRESCLRPGHFFARLLNLVSLGSEHDQETKLSLADVIPGDANSQFEFFLQLDQPLNGRTGINNFAVLSQFCQLIEQKRIVWV